ncbi:hypothetical protein [Roseovarius autotrophicus]|uniref:hypothetical protein n=1 Tax=Roseovarius autotrophicus TaxID=2824121 RepID=UPI0019E0DFD8|nr:hypothetical protein [Roseovarius autotrophicus]MBE0454508.1 hypothetical protein [Roseovarius sp.]
MGRDRWHVIEEDGALTLARRLPVRFDLAAETVLAGAVGRRRLAHLVRQDLWRMLRHLRGFAPAVRVRRVGHGVHVVAGGAVPGRVPPLAATRIADMLADPGLRARWMGQAR